MLVQNVHMFVSFLVLKMLGSVCSSSRGRSISIFACPTNVEDLVEALEVQEE